MFGWMDAFLSTAPVAIAENRLVSDRWSVTSHEGDRALANNQPSTHRLVGETIGRATSLLVAAVSARRMAASTLSSNSSEHSVG